MKKFNYLLLGAAALTMASCSQDDILNNVPDDGNYHLTVKLPADVATRALGNGLTADNLYMAVYDADNGNAFIYEDLTLGFNGQLSTEVSLNLAKGKSYNIAFFALSDEAQDVYTFNDNPATGAPNIFVNYEEMTNGNNNADAYDCFFKVYSIKNFSGMTQTGEVLLNRPVAQVNWGTNDLTPEYPAITNNFGDNGEFIVTGFNTVAFNTYNFFAGYDEASGNYFGDVDRTVPDSYSKVELADFTAPTSESFPVSGYKYVAMNYLLAPQSEYVYDLTLTVSNSGNPGATVIENDVEVANAPVQANYRTNIYGSLLSEDVTLTVTKDPVWGDPDKNFELINGVEYEVITSVNAANLKNGGNFILGGDVKYPSYGYLPLTKDTYLDLNNYTLNTYGNKSTGDAVVVGSGANVTIRNGVITPGEYSDPSVNPGMLENGADGKPKYGSAATVNLMSSGGGTLTLEDVTVIGNAYPVMLTSTNSSSQIIINSGNYYSSDEWYESDSKDVLVAVYVTGAGNVTINGGIFGKPGYSSQYLLNIQNGDKQNANKVITVKGGTFINFDPANNSAEGDGTNFVADGYQSVASQVGNDTYYTVVPANYTPAADQAALQAAVGTPNATIYLSGETYSFPTNVASGVTFIGGDNTTINVGGSKAAYYSNVTFKNIKFVGTQNYSGLQHSSNLTYIDCELDGIFFSYADGLQFKNCNFNQTNVDYNIWTYTADNVVFTNCNFNCVGKSVLIYNELSSAGAALNITFNNCNFTSSKPANDGKAAIEIGGGSPFNVNINNCKATGFDQGSLSGNSLWNHKTTTNPCTVTVNGQVVYTNP